MRRVFRLLTSVFILSFLLVAAAYSQGTQTGGITGVVTDQGGALVKGATVEIISETTGKYVRRIITGDEGSYNVNLLQPGTYRVEVTAPNFKKAVIADVQVRITESTRQDISLTAGRIEEVVNIETTPSLINTTTATTGQAVDSQTLQNLPLASPNFLFLFSLSAGTAGAPTDVRNAPRGAPRDHRDYAAPHNNKNSLVSIHLQCLKLGVLYNLTVTQYR